MPPSDPAVTVPRVFPALSDDDRRSFRAMLGSPLREAVQEAARLDDPADLELLSGELLPAGMLAEVPELAAEAVAAIAELPAALTLLKGMAAAAPPPLSTLAAEAVARIGEGPASVAAVQAGTLTPVRAWEVDADEPVTSVMVECRRPGFACSQVLCFTLEWPLTDGALKDGFVSGPVEPEQVEADFLGPVRAEGLEPAEIRPAAAIELVATGAARCAAAALGPSEGALSAAILLLRAGGRVDADELIEPLPALPGLEDFIDEVLAGGDEEALRAEIDELVAGLDGWCVGRGLDEDRRGLVCYAGGCMADFRAFHLGGDPGDWNAVELEDFLHDYAPRKVGLEPEDVDRFPDAVADVLRFLGETGRLEPRAADELAAQALDARAGFEEAAADPSNWGLAKGMVAAMSAAGVDPTDEAAVQDWIDAFNERPVEERERLVPALGSLPHAVAGGGGGRKRKAKAKKSQRQARKRNRGR